MYLSKLTIEGFKSFGEKISINFCKGLTVIVGPNGSGKSNILDAIKWVFGCRSLKEIRIDEVKNILFHGTNKNARFAEVSATLSDENGCNDDITICRRLYQDGTFEYYLNGQQVRLKDVKEFVAKNSSAFTDYSLFEQNNVDSIIKITPKERGKFFEDVAGLSYYRLKYDETLKTLQKINEKFSPLEKKIKEKEKEKELLEVEAEQTRDYLKTVEELKNTKKKMMVVNYKKIAHEADKYQIELNEIEKETCALYTSLINTMITSNQLKETLHDIKNAQETASNQMTIYLEARDKIYEELQKKQRDFQNLQEESNKIIASYDLLKKETFELTQKISSLTTEKTQLEVNLMSINQYLVGLEEIQRNLIENKTNLQSQVKDLEGKLLENNWELSNINNELSRLEKETKLESENQNQMLKKIREKNNIKEVSINSLEKLKKEIENLNKMLDSEKNSFKILEAEMKAIQEEKIKKQATLQILSEELDKLKNEQCSMREVIENEVKELKQYLAQLNQDKSQYVLLFDVLQFEENTPEQLLKFIGIFENAILCSKEAPLLAELTPPVNVFFIFPKNLTHDEQISFLSFLHQNHLICKNEMYIENLYAVFSYY
ncbi:MAG: AAA family ATPase, partial [Planctomycetota bacterium]